MTLDNDCIREILLTVESRPFNECLTLSGLVEKLPQYSEETLWYTCLKLEEGGLLNLVTVTLPGYGMPSIKEINDMTFKGHEFLSNIHDSKVWSGIKSIAAKIGAKSTEAIVQIASNVITELIKAQFGLS